MDGRRPARAGAQNPAYRPARPPPMVLTTCTHSAGLAELARVGAVDVEVPGRRHEPPAGMLGLPGSPGSPALHVPQRELRDHPLAAFEVAVEQAQHHELPRLDRGPDRLEDLGVGIPQGALPDAVVARRNIDVPDL